MCLEERKPTCASADPSVACGRECKPAVNAFEVVSMTPV